MKALLSKALIRAVVRDTAIRFFRLGYNAVGAGLTRDEAEALMLAEFDKTIDPTGGPS